MVFHMLDDVDRKLRKRIEKVALTAAKCGENGIVEWALRASHDAATLGRFRDKDMQTLQRLEGTFEHDFYRNSETRRESAFV